MSINLLPWRQIQHEEHYKKLRYHAFIYMSIFFFLSGMIKLFLVVDTQHLHSKILTLNQQISNIILNDPQHKNELLLQKLIYFHDKQKSIKPLNQAIQSILFHIANVIPNTLVLQQLSITENKIQLTGESNQLVDIHHYVNVLQSQKLGQSTQLINIQSDTKNHATMRFTIEMVRGKQQHEK